MNFSRFFIERPIFAGVISIMIFLGGLLSLGGLPISEYPEVVPPSIVVRAQFPGANPDVVAETVAAPLEEQINGVENMLYMSSQAGTDGSLAVTVTFKLGTDPDLAQQLVQNRVNQALPRLPDVVRLFGVSAVKSSPDLTMVVHLFSPNGSLDINYMHNYATLNVTNILSRLNGVGQVMAFGGGDYAMRLWLDPDKLAARNMTAGDVVNAVREQNVQVAAGVIGGQPSTGLSFELPVNARGRLTSPEDFGNIILKTAPDGTALIRLKDVSRIEMGSNSYSVGSLLNNKPAVGIGIFQSPGSNALKVSDSVRQTMDELKKDFPAGLDYNIVYDPTQFVRASIDSVIHTLLEAIALVVLVVILFLQRWRAAIIPLLAVPVSIVGTFAVMHLLGFSINNLTLFGLVLAIGIVVDDAIVVVENVERNIHNGLNPKAATIQAMKEVTSPIIATALVLCAVFIPLSFITGLTGQFYQQFAITIAISTLISTVNSLTLSPAMAALLLQPEGVKKDLLSRGIDKVFGRLFGKFNQGFGWTGTKYQHGVDRAIRRKPVMLLVYAVLLGLAVLTLWRLPQGYIPTQDKQYLVAFAQLPAGSSLDRTEAVIQQMSKMALTNPGVANAIAFPGLSVNGFAPSSDAGIVFLGLKSFEERKGHPELYGPAIAGQLMGQMGAIKDAFIAVFPPPAVMGLGTIGGFKLEIQDRNEQGDAALYAATQRVIGMSYQNPKLAGIFSSYEVNVPQLYADIDRDKTKQLEVNLADVFQTMQIYLASLYINDFNQFGHTYQVIAQADAPFRATQENMMNLKVRSATGAMVPLGSLMNVKKSFGPARAMRYNLFRAADINAGPAPGVSTGEAQKIMEGILQKALPAGFGYEWTDLTYQQILAGNTTMIVFPLCIFLVFLALAAQYESLTLPIAVLLIVPVVLFSALAGVWLTKGDNNIFTQIGLMVLVGLACKNAILIVEFARELELQGEKIIPAALTAARLRLRPILMTSMAFIMGVTPLVFSSGAGAEMRHAIGITVFSGMIGVTFFGLFLTPVFYVVIRTLAGGKLHSAGEVHKIDCDEEKAGAETGLLTEPVTRKGKKK